MYYVIASQPDGWTVWHAKRCVGWFRTHAEAAAFVLGRRSGGQHA